MSTQDYFATAFIRVKPDPAGFRTALREQLAVSLRGVTAKVPLIIEPTPFQRRLQAAVSRTKIKIPVIPETAEFKALLEAKLAGMTVAVPVTVVPGKVTGAAAAARTTAGVGTRAAAGTAGLAGTTAATQAAAQAGTKLTAVQLAQLEIQTQLRTANRLYAESMLKVTGSEERLTALGTALADVERSIAANLRAADRAFVEKNTQLEQAIIAENQYLTSLRETIIGERNAAAAAVQSARQRAAASVAASRQGRAAAAESLQQQKLIARGAAATGLSILGVRGATLAASAAFLAGAAAVAAFAKAIAGTAAFETELNVFRATTSATADQMERVRAAAIALGNDITLPAVNASNAATAMTELAKAGLNVTQAIAGARGVLQLATAANIDLAAAVQLAANALNAFELSGNDAIRVADVLANAANAAQGSIADMGAALAQAAAVGHQVGLSFEDTATFITDLAKAGLRGSDAGTSLRVALLRVVNPSKEARAAFDKLGVSVRDAEGNLKPQFFVELGIALRGMSKAQRDATLATIGGQDAVRSLSILTRQNLRQLLQTRRELREQGTAAEVAAARTMGLAGAAEQLKNTLSTVGLAAQNLSPALESVVLGVNAVIQGFASSDEVAGALHASLSLVGDSFHVVGAAASFAGPPVIALAEGLAQLTLAIGLPEILAGVAAFRLFPALLIGAGGAASKFSTAFAGARVAAAEFAAAVAIGGPISTGLASMRVGLAAASVAVTGFLGTVAGVATVAAVAAAGLIYLFTQESTLERQTRSIARATDDYAAALDRLKTASRGQASAERTVAQERLAVDQALLARARAQQALQASDAPRGSLERKQLEVDLAVATQNVTFATQDYTQAVKDLAAAQDEAKAAEANNNQERLKQIQTVQDLAKTDRDRANALKDSPAAQTFFLRQFTESLRKQAREEKLSSDEFERDLGRRKQLLADVAAFIKAFPSEKRVQLIFNAEDLRAAVDQVAPLFAQAGFKSADAFRDFLLRRLGLLPPEVANEVSKAAHGIESRAASDFAIAGTKNANSYWDAFIEAFKAGANRMQSIQTQLDLAIIAGVGAQGQLDILRQAQAQAQRNLDTINAQLAKQPSLAKSPAFRERRRQAIADLRAAAEAVRQQEEEIRSAAEQARDKVLKAQNDADQAILDAFGRREAKATLNQAHIEATEKLSDDIALTNVLIRLYQAERREAAKRIKNEETRTAVIADLTRKIKDEQQKRRDLLKQQAADQAEEARARRDRLEEILQLDVEIAETTGNKRAQARALNAEIAFYKKQIAAAKGNELLRKQYILKLRQAQRDLKELKKELAETKNQFRAMAFEFLSTQQGFAATLLGNLLPGVAVAGVGGTSQPRTSPAGGPLTGPVLPGLPSPQLPRGAALPTGPQGVISEAAQKAASRERGVSHSQAQRTNALLLQVIHQLILLNSRTKHPEAKKHQAHASSHMDE
jgi:TP901 family phage tail tape measure protein